MATINTDLKSGKLRKQLYLTETAVRQGEDLKGPMCRPSFSNVVEALIDAEHKRVFKAEPQVKEAA